MRRLFWIFKRQAPSKGYDVQCVICKKQSEAWDYRRNALIVGFAHIVMEHVAPGLRDGAGWK